MTGDDEQERLIAIAERVLTRNYRQQPIVLRRGAACSVWDVAGNKYLDLTGGIAACPLGHAHLGLAVGIAEQALKLLHVSNLYYVEAQIQLADKLAELAHALGEPRVFFCNSGAEANEAAIKLAKRYQHSVRNQPERVEVLAFDGSFHGRTIATVSLTGQEKYRSGFGPLIDWARFLPWPESAEDRRALDAVTERTCAVIVEPIQAEGGIRVPPPGWLARLKQRCAETGTVLIFDEVQTGAGRTGTFFGYEQEDCAPDILSLAKGLGGGVPIGAIVASGEVARGFEPGTHASTFGGNPLACAAALIVIEAIEKQGLLQRVREAGARLAAGLADLARRHGARGFEARGRGLLRGLKIDGDAAPIVKRARERGVLLSVAGGQVVRFVPPFIVNDAEIDQGLEALAQALATG